MNAAEARLCSTARKSGQVKDAGRKTHTPTKPAQNISGLFYSVVILQMPPPGRASAEDLQRIANCNE